MCAEGGKRKHTVNAVTVRKVDRANKLKVIVVYKQW